MRSYIAARLALDTAMDDIARETTSLRGLDPDVMLELLRTLLHRRVDDTIDRHIRRVTS